MVNAIEIKELSQLIGWYNELQQLEDKWVFRGEEYDIDETKCDIDITKTLKTTLEKAFERMGGHSREHKRTAEKDIIREFQRKLHLYTSNVPARPDILQWLALMQHHGAPTRLLDWTYSFWIAVYFAIERRKPEEKATIWAVNATQTVADYESKKAKFDFSPKYKEILDRIEGRNDLPYCDTDAIADNVATLYLFENPQKMILASGSFRRNQRLTLQQGTFLIPGDITESFRSNLFASIDPDNEKHIQLRVIEITRELKKDIVKHLQEMNIKNEVLFPDLDGFCGSLWTRVGLSLTDKLMIGDNDLTLY